MNGDAATIGINGFGRIGRALLRASLANALVKVVAINDPYMTAEYAAYLLGADSACGSTAADLVVEAKEGAIVVNGSYIEVTQRSDPCAIPWRVTYVVDCSGVFTTQERAGQHLASGAGRVIVANPGADIPTFVVGVNEDRFAPSMQVISAGSPTGVVLCNALRLLGDAMPLEFVSFTAIHALTSQQKVVDGMNVKDWAGARASSNTIPFATGAQRTVQKVLPGLANSVVGSSYHVPTGRGCVLDLVVRSSAPLTRSHIDDALGRSPTAGARLAVVKGPSVGMVSGDVAQFINNKVNSSVGGNVLAAYDASGTQLVGDRTAKICLWYDNEASYAKALLALVLATNARW